MKTFKYIIQKALFVALPLLGGVGGGLLTSCSDVDIPEAANAGLGMVSNVETTVNNRSVTLTWAPVTGDVQQYNIYMNGNLIKSVEPTVTSYTIDKVETGVELAFTVKALYADGTMSKGVTTFVTVEFAGLKSAYLLLGDNLDDDEQASHDWFDRNYVQAAKGDFIALDALDRLDPEIYACLMIHIDRVGLDKGADRLPLDDAQRSAIAAYAKKGGNLFLSNHATQLVAALGRIDAKYDVNIYGSGEGGNNPDIWNICPYLGYACDPRYDYTTHPLYTGCQLANVSDWAPGISTAAPGHKEDHNCCWDLNAYGFDLNRYGNTVNAYQKVNKCQVIGTWSHVKDYAVGAVIDFGPTATWAGRIVAIGTNCYEWHQEGNEYQAAIEMIAANALNYMSEVPEYTPSTDDAFYGYIALDDFNNLDDDEQASYNWFRANYVDAAKGAFIDAATINHINAEDYACIMIHVDRVGMGYGVDRLPAELGGERILGALAQYVKDGGNLFLSNHASLLVQGIGRIPDNCRITIFGDGEGGAGGDYWSLCPFQGYQDYDNPSGNCDDHTGHPIFRGLTFSPELNEWNFPPGYAMIGKEWREDHNCCWDVNAMGYQGGVNNIRNFEADQLCTCLATWTHVRDWCVSTVTEFLPKDDFRGRIIAIGANCYEWHQNVGVNPFQSNVEAVAKNALDYLSE